ncbi:proline-rich protein 36-like [Drosophila subpulchrella]|uniref:proline-rich protein 36-like n=1 Tax=Drosophila subpulchrella TaxID=1486046 RepID=UPI0018A13CFC|nr:proline-rich protein 36-like [Drosophila subpulchrella]
MAKKTTYKMPERNLDLPADLAFVSNLLKDLGLEAEPSARGVILDLAYTLARDKLVEAQRFATMSNRTNVGIEDLQMAVPERNVPLERNPKESTENIKKKMAQPEQTDQPGTSSKVSTQAPKLLAKEASQEPGSSKGPMQPTWRDDQVGQKADLKTTGAEQDNPKSKIRAGPSKPVAPPVTPTTSGAGPSQRTPSTAKKPRLNAKASKPVVPPVTPTTSAAAPPQRTPSAARKPRITAKSSKPVAPPATPTTTGADPSQRTPTVVKKPRTRIVQQK